MSLFVGQNWMLSRLFSPEAMVLSLGAQDRDGVLKELIDTIPDLTNMPQARNALFEALLERERLSSTALGNGVALPHTRNTIANLAGRTMVVFGRHPKGIVYGEGHRSPVQLCFLLLAPTVSLHLQALSRLSRLLRQSELRQNLLAAETAEEVMGFVREAEERM
jgi:mannitol/fructose-specific phosphotransferase system IIA component (Ntr-type)